MLVGVVGFDLDHLTFPGNHLYLVPKVRHAKSGEDIMVLKAYNGRCVLSWLGQELLEALEVHHDNDLLVLVASCTKLCLAF